MLMQKIDIRARSFLRKSVQRLSLLRLVSHERPQGSENANDDKPQTGPGTVSWPLLSPLFFGASIGRCTWYALRPGSLCNRPELLTSWLQIFATFNGLALIHMFLTAPETKGKTLEEMDSVFDSGIPPWKAGKIDSRLDQLQRDIEAGTVKVGPHTNSRHVESVTHEPKL
jgi:hypothetical protein